MTKYFVILGLIALYVGVIWWNMPGESEQQKTWRYIDAMIAQSKAREREKHFCPTTGIYAP